MLEFYKTKINRAILLGIFTLVCSFNASYTVAQQKNKLEYSGFFDSYYHRGPISYTLSGGLSAYNGDLCGEIACQTLNYNFGIGLNYKVWPRTVFGVEFNYFTLGATDEVANRNISFTSTNYELVVYGRFYFIDDIVRVAADRSRKYKKIKPYFTLGAGGLLYTPVSTYYAPPVDSVFRTEGVAYPGITAVFPAGFGLQYVFSPRVSVIGELTYRLTLSDYIDDVGAVRGNSKGLPDSYGFFNIKLQVTPSAPAKKKKRSLPVPESTGIGGGSSSGGGGATAPASDTTNTAVPNTAEGVSPDNTAPAQDKPVETPANDLQNLQPAEEKKEETK